MPAFAGMTIKFAYGQTWVFAARAAAILKKIRTHHEANGPQDADRRAHFGMKASV